METFRSRVLRTQGPSRRFFPIPPVCTLVLGTYLFRKLRGTNYRAPWAYRKRRTLCDGCESPFNLQFLPGNGLISRGRILPAASEQVASFVKSFSEIGIEFSQNTVAI